MNEFFNEADEVYSDGPDEYQYCETCHATVIGFVNYPFWECEACGSLYEISDLAVSLSH